jgi:hypothetical protein
MFETFEKLQFNLNDKLSNKLLREIQNNNVIENKESV